MEKEEREEQLLESAVRVFAAKGYRGTTVDSITGEIGVSRGTFYNYFGSKDDIFQRVIEQYFAGFEEIIENNHERITGAVRDGGDVIDAWRHNALDVFRFHAENPTLTAVMYREAAGLGIFTRRYDVMSSAATVMLEAQFRMLVERKMIVDLDPALIAAIVNGSVLAIVLEWILPERTMDLEKLASDFVLYHVRALWDRAEGRIPPPFETDLEDDRRTGIADRRKSGVVDRRGDRSGDRRKGPRDRREAGGGED